MKTPFFDSLIDDFGIWQHTNGTEILKEEGYALDDAARGLLICLALGKKREAEVLFSYLMKSYKDGKFYGFVTAEQTFIKFPASEDATGQVVWAMGYAYSLDFHKDDALQMIRNLVPSTTSQFKNVRGYAYALLGTIYADAELSKQLVGTLKDFFRNITDDWLWPEDVMTYGNGILPYAFLRYGLICNDKESADFGKKLLAFVQEKCQQNRILGPIGNDGWLPKGTDTAPDYSQQPIDAAYMIWAWITAYQIYNDEQMLRQADRWAEWFEGNNIKHEKMYDADTLKCYDGIDKDSVHYHSGAESNICLLLSLHILSTKTTI